MKMCIRKRGASSCSSIGRSLRRTPGSGTFRAFSARHGPPPYEYLLDRGAHADVPVADIMAIFAREYPRLVERGAGEPATRFREEAR